MTYFKSLTVKVARTNSRAARFEVREQSFELHTAEGNNTTYRNMKALLVD
jgi:hypothetical protein